MDDIELETRSMVDEGAELKHGVTCLRSRPIENSLLSVLGGIGVRIAFFGKIKYISQLNMYNWTLFPLESWVFNRTLQFSGGFPRPTLTSFNSYGTTSEYLQLRDRWHLCCLKMFCGEPEGHCHCTKRMSIMPSGFFTEHRWLALTPLWISADSIENT